MESRRREVGARSIGVDGWPNFVEEGDDNVTYGQGTQMSLLTLVSLLVVAYGVLNPLGYGRALALGGATASGVTVVVGSTAVPTFYAVSIGAAVAIALKLLGNGRVASIRHEHLPPGATLLLLFFAWSVFVTLVAPLLFNGMSVFTGTGPKKLTAGFVTSSNVAQLIYLLLGICVVIFLARSSSAGPGLIGLAAGVSTLLSLWRYFHQEVGIPFPEGLFDNSPNAAFIETAPGNVQRFRGILSEPAGLAGTSLVTAAYMLPRSFQLRGWRRAGAFFMASVATYLGAISTSATFVVAGVSMTLIAGLTFIFRFLIRRTSLSALVGVVTCALIIVSLWALPIIADFVQSTINEKVASSSFSERSGADSTSYNIFLDTFGFGTGLGSNRASSFFPGLLSTAGVIGTLLFIAAVTSLIRRTAPLQEYRPVIWALVTLLVAKVVAGPDLSDTTGITWIALGLLSSAAQRPNARTPLLRMSNAFGAAPAADRRPLEP